MADLPSLEDVVDDPGANRGLPRTQENWLEILQLLKRSIQMWVNSHDFDFLSSDLDEHTVSSAMYLLEQVKNVEDSINKHSQAHQEEGAPVESNGKGHYL